MSQEKYKELIESIELNKIQLLSLECRQNKEFPAEKRGDLRIALKDNIVETKFEGIELQIQIQFNVIAFNNGENSNESQEVDEVLDEDILFRVDFSLDLSYVLSVEKAEDALVKFTDEVNRFAEKNVPINAWPYARETISSITTRMGFPALVIPTYKNLPPF